MYVHIIIMCVLHLINGEFEGVVDRYTLPTPLSLTHTYLAVSPWRIFNFCRL